MIGDDYGDLADAVLRGAIIGGETLGADRLRARYTIRLASWETMLHGLLKQLAGDAGSTREALALLGTPASLVRPWLRDPVIGTEASACWLASQQRDADPRVALRELLGPWRPPVTGRSTRLGCAVATRSIADRGSAWSRTCSARWSRMLARSSARRRCWPCR
jgi:hypothetical protein